MNIQHYLPSRRVRIFLIALLFLAFAFLGYFLVDTYLIQEDTKENTLSLSLVTESGTPIDSTDSDNDGAYDWEEVLWGLDPQDPDSDGDGVRDGKYIEAQQQVIERERSGGSLPESNLTESEKLSRSVVSAIMAIEQSGGVLDEANGATIANNVSDYISDMTFGDRIYTRDQFALIEDTKENSYAYRDVMKALFKKYPVATSDIALLIKASERNDDYQGQLRSTSLGYRKYLEALASMEVPSLIAGRHTQLTNNISQILSAMENLMLAEPEELITLSSIVQIDTILLETTEAIVMINTYFDIISDDSLFEEGEEHV